ncbi:hypothetical protein TWF730_005149 [Orbilia blumenaviensis]|uniref:MYND-type domain-containing protein n=1 Tax=Orbilia blumenaviensis TaxID=1796055 RepID=A0AAV9VHG5_9PEZI
MTDNSSEVLALHIGSESENSSVIYRHGEFLEKIKRALGLTIIKDPGEAIEYINTHHPAFILVMASEFAKPANRRLQDEVAFIVEHGAALIMCGEFPGNVAIEDFKNMSLNSLGLGWELGPIHRGNYELYKTCDILEGIHRSENIENELQMMAALLHNVEDRSRLYICKDFDQSQGEKFAAVAFEKRGEGYFGWVGDLNGLGPMHNVVFKFIDVAGPKFRAGRLRGLRNGRNMPQTHPRGGRPAVHFRNKAIRAQKALAPPQSGPCDNCGRDFTTQICFDCRAVFYCSMNCMNSSSRKHKVVCAARRVTLGEAIEMADQGDPMPLVKELIVSPKDHQEVLERLIDCYRFRVKDLHKISGIDTGCYRKSNEGEVHLEEFVSFLRQLQRSNQPVRPPWWELASQVQCEDMACNHIMRYYIGNPIDEDEVVAYYDEKLMPAALRALGLILYNGPVPEREEKPRSRKESNFMATQGVREIVIDIDDLPWDDTDLSDGTDDIDRAIRELQLQNSKAADTMAVIETKDELSTSSNPEPPEELGRQASPSVTEPPPPPPPPAPQPQTQLPPRTAPQKPEKRAPIVHVWEPPTSN